MFSDSHYHRQPGVSPARIVVYPKRRLSDLPQALKTIPVDGTHPVPRESGATYADFFQHGALRAVPAFIHIVDQPDLIVAADESPAEEARGA